MNVALIGLGHVAQYQIEALSSVSEMDLVAAHDIDITRAAFLPTHVRFVADLDQLLALPNVDLFVVSTPNVSHYEVGKRVLEANRPLVLEKPCTETSEQLNELIALSQANAQLLIVALHAAYARDVLWFMEYLETHASILGPLTGFHAGFFDPYYQDGDVVPAAQSLGGAWFDSGINALSVVGRFVDPANLVLVEGRMTSVRSLPWSELQGAASFVFKDGDYYGDGIVETNWCLGINRKVTQLFYATTNTRVTLNHSQERVVIERAGAIMHEENLQNGHPRLTNHYKNLFTEVELCFRTRTTNLDYAEPLHRLLFEARQPRR